MAVSQSNISKIYRAMAITSCVIPQEVVEGFLADWSEVFPDKPCLAMHNTVVSLYEYLIKQSAIRASGGGKVKEKTGKREIELDGANKSVDWENALDDYLDNPSAAFPTCRAELGNMKGRVIVGGVDESKIQEINDDPNIRTGGANEVCGVGNRGKYGLRNVPEGWTLRIPPRGRC